MTTLFSRATSAGTRKRWRTYLHAVRRLGWGVADQGISSLSNFALGLFVARSFGATEFGAFTLAYVTYSVVINAARGLSTDPLLVRFSGVADSDWRRAASEAAGTALSVGITVGALCACAGLILPHPIGPVFLALGIALPALTLQDSWRFAFFASGRGLYAFLNDAFWTALLIGGLWLLRATDTGSAPTCLLVFGATAAAAAVLGAVQCRTVPRPNKALAWVRTHSDLSFRYLAENVSISGASQIRSFVLGAAAGLAAVGYVRASEILMGPFLVILMGLSQVAVPEAARVLARDPHHLRRFCLALGSVQAGGAILWGVFLVVMLPLGLGQLVLKDMWRPTYALIPIIVITVVAASYITAATAGLRAMGVAQRSLRAQLLGSALYATLGSLGAIIGGAVGTSCGVALAQSISATIWWHQLNRALMDRLPERHST